VTVEDQSPPGDLAGLPALPIILDATSAAGAPYSWNAITATDTVDGLITATCAPVSGSTFALGPPTTVTCTAADTAGRSSTDSFTVTVTDLSPPELPPLLDLTIQATDTNGTPVFWSEVISDTVDGPGSLSCSPASGSAFVIGGPTPVTCVASDVAGNTNSTAFNVTVVDTTAPVIDPVTPPDGFDPDSPFPFQLDADKNKLTLTWPVSVTDADPKLDVGCAIEGVELMHGGLTLVGDQVTATFSYDFPVGDTSVSCTATDSVNLPTTFDFIVTVLDTTDPILTVPTNPVVVESQSSSAVVDYASSVSVYDAGYPLTEAVCTPASGTDFTRGDTEVICNATDGSGNPADSATFTVTVRYPYDIQIFLPKRAAKLGSTIPLDWQYYAWDGEQRGLPVDSSALAPHISWATTNDCVNEVANGIAGEDSGSSKFRYSTSGMLWQYSLQSKDEDLVKGKYLITISPPGKGVPGASDCITLK